MPYLRFNFQPGRWWRVITPTGIVWCETSDEAEARSSMREGDLLQRLYVADQPMEWRNVV